MRYFNSIVGGIARMAAPALLVAFGLLAHGTAKAQDVYQIEQTFEHDFMVKSLTVNKGWDVRLVQTPQGTPTKVVVSTPYAEFFEDGAEPELLQVSKHGKKRGAYEIKENTMMPRSTVVEVYCSQPFKEITLAKDARLTIVHYEFDSVKLDIFADTGAVLVVDTMSNRTTDKFMWTSIFLYNATLDLRHYVGRSLSIYAYGESTVKEGDIEAGKQKIHLSHNAQSNVTVTDSARNIYVEYPKLMNTSRKGAYISLGYGLDVSQPTIFTSNKTNSPYNTNYAFNLHFILRTEDIRISEHWSWSLGLDFKLSNLQLDNVVKVQDGRLVLDDSYGATPPRQSLCYWSIGLPISLQFSTKKANNPLFFCTGLTLTPTYNFKPFLNSTPGGILRADVLNRFNVRAAISFSSSLFPWKRTEFYVDLLPTYKSSADAPQTRMFGLSFIF